MSNVIELSPPKDDAEVLTKMSEGIMDMQLRMTRLRSLLHSMIDAQPCVDMEDLASIAIEHTETTDEGLDALAALVKTMRDAT
jgi:hypothetical protein